MPSNFWARTDSGSANNPALNLTGANAVNITFVPSGGSGDLFLDQPTGGGVDPDTQVSIGGTDYDFVFELSGTMPTQNRDGAQQVPDQFEGSAVYVITVQDYPAAGDTTRLAFMPEETATQTEMDAFGNGAIDVQNVDETPAPGPVCFARGTHISTKRGEIAIENLEKGDWVVTLDHGLQQIRWIGSTTFLARGKHAPIEIRKGALGNVRDLRVSPQHRMMLQGWRQELFTGVLETLATSKFLVNNRTIRQVEGGMVEYFHILFDEHEIVFAEGVPSESFHPGEVGMNSLTDETREAIYALFPDLRNDVRNFGPTARACLKSFEARLFSSEFPMVEQRLETMAMAA